MDSVGHLNSRAVDVWRSAVRCFFYGIFQFVVGLTWQAIRFLFPTNAFFVPLRFSPGFILFADLCDFADGCVFELAH